MSSPPREKEDESSRNGVNNDVKEVHEWSAFYDDEGRIYYYNSASGESSWDAPEKFNPPPKEEGTEVGEQKVDSSETGDASPDKDADAGVEHGAKSEGPGPWLAYKDDEGREYYFNTVTEETTWDMPPDFQAATEKAEEANLEALSPSQSRSPPPAGHENESPAPKEEEEMEVLVKEEPEVTVDPAVKRVQDAERALNQPDAIMEPDAMAHVTEVVTSEDGNPQKAIQALSESYYGQTAVCGLLSSWLAGLKSQSQASTSDSVEKSRLFSNSADDIRQMTQDVVIRIAKEKFTKTGGDSILHLSRQTAGFLEDMIDSNRWRQLLIDLSASNKDSALLNYCLQKISKRGHHREIARRINQSDHFAVFNAMLASELTVVGKMSVSACHDSDTSIGLDELVSDLRRTCTSTAYTYIYAIEVLRYLVATAKERSASAGRNSTSRFSRVIRNWERLNEDLQSTMVDPTSSAGSTPLFRKRRLDLAVTISELHQRQRRRLRPSDDSNDSANQGMNDRRAKVESAVLNFLRRYSLGTKIDDRVLDAMLPDTLVGDPENLAGNLLMKRPLTIQALLGYMYKPGAQRVGSTVTKNKCARLIALAVQAAEKEASVEAKDAKSDISPESDEVGLTRKLSEGSQLCERLENMVSFIITTGTGEKGSMLTPGEQLCSLAVKCPPVAQGVAMWARELTGGNEFVTSASYPTVSPSILSLVRVLYIEYPFIRDDVLAVAFGFLKHSNSEISYQKMNEIKEQSLRLLLFLMVKGEAPTVLGRMTNILKRSGNIRLDASLVRYFVSGLLEVAREPFSIPLTRSLASLLMAPGCVEAVRTSYFDGEDKDRLDTVMKCLKEMLVGCQLNSSDARLLKTLLSTYSS